MTAQAAWSGGGKVRVGCSGFVYKHWRGGVFYPEKWPVRRELEFYATQFETVELNNPFYHLPPRSTFEKWKAGTPAGFDFAVKASRLITHLKRLHDCGEALDLFLDHAAGLGRKLGPILFQFPARWDLHLDRLRAFLPLLPRRLSFAFEFRHASWFQPEVYRALEHAGAGLCLPVSPALPEPPLVATSPLIYLRLHAGHGRDGNFEDDELRLWARRMHGLMRQAQQGYAFFNNDWQGLAPRNARTFRHMLGGDFPASGSAAPAGMV